MKQLHDFCWCVVIGIVMLILAILCSPKVPHMACLHQIDVQTYRCIGCGMTKAEIMYGPRSESPPPPEVKTESPKLRWGDVTKFLQQFGYDK